MTISGDFLMIILLLEQGKKILNPLNPNNFPPKTILGKSILLDTISLSAVLCHRIALEKRFAWDFRGYILPSLVHSTLQHGL